MSNRTANLLSLLFIAATACLGAAMYAYLPDPMPSHWNAAGEVDGYLPKFQGVAIMPLAAVGILLLMKILPVISPKGFRLDEFRGVVNVIQVVLVGFTCGVGVLVYLEASGIDVHMEGTILGATGVLFAVLGNYLGKVRKNFFIGFRTPWTLASTEVWNRTHRLGGWLMMLAGAYMVVAAVLGLSAVSMIVVVCVFMLYPVLHSFLLYRRIEGFGPDEGG